MIEQSGIPNWYFASRGLPWNEDPWPKRIDFKNCKIMIDNKKLAETQTQILLTSRTDFGYDPGRAHLQIAQSPRNIVSRDIEMIIDKQMIKPFLG